jgi:NADPH-dependent 2,4-dienoyl-CoA reductase/sulfur reductase-like enzyme
MGRALLADPELPMKTAAGALGDIRKCTACDECIARLFFNENVACSVNAALGMEEEYTITKAKVSKRILVVGGGPAGLEAARVSALRGHSVVLYEKSDRLGGQLNLAVIPPHKEEMKSVATYLESQIKRLGVKVMLGEEVTPPLVKKINPDVVFVAAGSLPNIPEIPGVKGRNVVTANDALAGRVLIQERVVVVGGGMIGAETAEFLAEKGKRVTVLEMLGRIGIDMVPMVISLLYLRLKRLGVVMITNAKVEEITHDGVVYEKGGEKQTVEADSVVLAVGSKPSASLMDVLKGNVSELYAIGNAREPCNVLEAIHEGSRLAREV